MNGGMNGSDKLVVPLVCLHIALWLFQKKYVPIYRNDFSLSSALDRKMNASYIDRYSNPNARIIFHALFDI